MALPQLTEEQRAAALEKAAAARRTRAELKDRLKRGGTTIKEVLNQSDNDDVLGKMKVSALLEAMPGVGKVRAAADHGASRDRPEPPPARPGRPAAQGAAGRLRGERESDHGPRPRAAASSVRTTRAGDARCARPEGPADRPGRPLRRRQVQRGRGPARPRCPSSTSACRPPPATRGPVRSTAATTGSSATRVRRADRPRASCSSGPRSTAACSVRARPARRSRRRSTPAARCSSRSTCTAPARSRRRCPSR